MRVFCRFAPPRYQPNEDPSCKSLHIALEDCALDTKTSKINRTTPHTMAQKLLTVAEVQTGASVSVGCSGVYFPIAECTQEQVFNDVVMPILPDIVLRNHHNTVLAYGQTSTGKSHTIFGPDGGNALYFDAVDAKGLVPRIAEALFGREWADETNHQKKGSSTDTVARVTAVDVKYFEIYNETACDLVAKALDDIYGGAAAAASSTPSSRGATPASSRSSSMGGGRNSKIKDGTTTTSGFGFKVSYKPTDKARLARSLQKITCRNAKELHQLLGKLTELREVQATDNNWKSSRSHVVIQLHMHTAHSDGKEFSPTSSSTSAGGGVLTIVDLAGSESFKGVTHGGMMNGLRMGGGDGSSSAMLGTTGGIPDIFERPSEQLRLQEEAQQRMQETKNINTSLFALKKVVQCLAHGNQPHIPYNDSMLTSVLAKCLRPDSVLIACCSSDGKEIAETLSTLRFACEASKMKPVLGMVQSHKRQVLEVQRKHLQVISDERAERQAQQVDRAMHHQQGCGARQGKATTKLTAYSRTPSQNVSIDDHDDGGDANLHEGVATAATPPTLRKFDDQQYLYEPEEEGNTQLNSQPLSPSNGRVEMLLAIIQQLKQDLKNSQEELANAKGVVATVTDQFEELSADYELVCGQLDDAKAATATMEERHEDELRECKLEISCLRNELYLVDERGKVAIQSAVQQQKDAVLNKKKVQDRHHHEDEGEDEEERRHYNQIKSSSRHVDPQHNSSHCQQPRASAASTVLRRARMASEESVEDGRSPRVVGISAVQSDDDDDHIIVPSSTSSSRRHYPHNEQQLSNPPATTRQHQRNAEYEGECHSRRHQQRPTSSSKHVRSEDHFAEENTNSKKDESSRRSGSTTRSQQGNEDMIVYLKTGFLASGRGGGGKPSLSVPLPPATDAMDEFIPTDTSSSYHNHNTTPTFVSRELLPPNTPTPNDEVDTTTAANASSMAALLETADALEMRLWGGSKKRADTAAEYTDEDNRRQSTSIVDKNNAASPTSILDPESIASAYERFCVKDDSASSTTRRSSRHLAAASTSSSSSRIVGNNSNNIRSSPSTSSPSTRYRSSTTRAPMMAPSSSPSSTTPATATITSRHAAADVDTTTPVHPPPMRSTSTTSSSGAHYVRGRESIDTSTDLPLALAESSFDSTVATTKAEVDEPSSSVTTRPPSPPRAPLNPMRQEIAKLLQRPLKASSSSLMNRSNNTNAGDDVVVGSDSQKKMSTSSSLTAPPPNAAALNSMKPSRHHQENGAGSDAGSEYGGDEKENYFRARSKSPNVSVRGSERQRVVQVFSPESEIRMNRGN